MLHVHKNNYFYLSFILFIATGLFTPNGTYAADVVTEPVDETRSRFITDISTSEDNDSISVAITCNTPLNYMSVKQVVPLGLLLYFPKTSLGLSKTEYDIDNVLLGTIKANKLIEKNRLKITIPLKKDWPFQIIREGDVIKVVFTRIPETETETAESMQPKLPIENKLINVIPQILEDKIKIVVRTNSQIEEVKTLTLTNPPRIVFDLYGVETGQKSQLTKIPFESQWSNSIRYFFHPGKLRVVLDTKAEYLNAFKTETLDNGLIVIVGSGIKTP